MVSDKKFNNVKKGNFMFGKTNPKKVHPSRWYIKTFNPYTVTDSFNKIDYDINSLFAAYENKELTLWHEGRYLTTLEISKNEANRLFEVHKLNRCKTSVPLNFSVIFTSRNGTEFFFIGKDLCTKEHAFSVERLSFTETQGSLNVSVDGKNIAVFESDNEKETFYRAQKDAMSIAEAKMDSQSLEDSKAISALRTAERAKAEEAEKKREQEAEFRRNGYNHIILTTESISPFAVRKRLGIVTAEYVYRSTIFSSLVAEISSIGETRQSSTQNALKEARTMALTELRREAHNLGADAVVAVDLDYSEVAGAGSPMMFLVASGTAIEIDK